MDFNSFIKSEISKEIAPVRGIIAGSHSTVIQWLDTIPMAHDVMLCGIIEQKYNTINRAYREILRIEL